MTLSVSETFEVLRLDQCTVLGGSGHGFTQGESVDLIFTEGGLTAKSGSFSEIFHYAEIATLDIVGPGAVTTGGGFVGGGFGVSGALEGIGIASILNALTSRTKIHTFIALITHVGELHLHYSEMEPGSLRVALASVFSALRRLDPIWIGGRLERLEALRRSNAIDDAELERLKTRLTTQPNREPLASRMGICPGCDSKIPLLTTECPKCKANFSADAGWRIRPI